MRLSITHLGNVNVANASGKVWSLQYKPRTRIKNIEDEMLISPDFGIDGNIFSVMIPISGYRLKLVDKNEDYAFANHVVNAQIFLYFDVKTRS